MNFKAGDRVESTVRPGTFFTISKARRGGGFFAKSDSGRTQKILTASAWRAAPASKANAGGSKG